MLQEGDMVLPVASCSKHTGRWTSDKCSYDGRSLHREQVQGLYRLTLQRGPYIPIYLSNSSSRQAEDGTFGHCRNPNIPRGPRVVSDKGGVSATEDPILEVNTLLPGHHLLFLAPLSPIHPHSAPPSPHILHLGAQQRRATIKHLAI
jgi:hypothetical protein